jgi:hypothetical protein
MLQVQSYCRFLAFVALPKVKCQTNKDLTINRHCASTCPVRLASRAFGTPEEKGVGRIEGLGIRIHFGALN